ncbi:hypothetical protein CesoFtcFv8_009811 [Champsocephalus esox]|uniref:Uncharacterized protein n=1 Tax=Champsocephalus esox TaxID=159716 RepID=A0AAN8C6U0_9TELE|nr:hypothetical protein CesoFtcFv8_009811 [Champsocephalus esox]
MQWTDDCDGSHLAVLYGSHPIKLALIDQQALPLDGGHGNINHSLPSIWMAFLKKSKNDKVYMKFKEVDFLSANTVY